MQAPRVLSFSLTMAEESNNTVSEVQVARDAIESIYVAIVLAFVLRAFLVEAFVIPTGSMAERLYGEHYRLQCPACAYEYAYGKEDKSSAPVGVPVGAVCPNCNYSYSFGGPPAVLRAGDRVLVLKYPYQFSSPQPWDVVVFKNLQNNHDNYIKRLIALPGETIEIVHGDIFIKQGGPFSIRRKPHRVQEAMWQVIYNADYPPDPEWIGRYNQWVVKENQRRAEENRSRAQIDLPPLAYLEPLRPPTFAPASDDQAAAWSASQAGRVLHYSGQGDPAVLAFTGKTTAFLPWYGYNPRPDSDADRIELERDIVSDLKLATTFVPGSAESTVRLELSSFEHHFQARFSADGSVQLLHRERTYPEGFTQWETWGQAQADISPGRPSRLELTHADFRVTVWVDGQALLQTTDQQYAADHEELSSRMNLASQLGQDLEQAAGEEVSQTTRIRLAKGRDWFQRPPTVRITAEAGPCQLRHLKLMRDVYYTSANLEPLDSGGDKRHNQLYSYAHRLADDNRMKKRLITRQGVWSEPGRHTGWAVTGNPLTLRGDPDNPSDLDEFFVMGDNSPQSHDGRSWTMASPTLRLYDEQGNPQYQLGTVPRYNLLGRAMFVYWPSGFRLPGLPRISLVPNVGRMRFIK